MKGWGGTENYLAVYLHGPSGKQLEPAWRCITRGKLLKGKPVWGPALAPWDARVAGGGAVSRLVSQAQRRTCP